MTSILTNGAATAALQNLRSISTGLGETQRMVSSGLRVAIAADNAAYWSISTTMRSDQMAVSAVSDALGLGEAKVDTAYSGMSSVIDVLSEFKAKLVAAKEDGIDKAKIQTELQQLKDQVLGIATSASFSGENWLNADFLDSDYDQSSIRSVVSSFSRSANGSVSLHKTELDLKTISLFEASGDGILQPDAAAAFSLGGLSPNPPEATGSTGFMFNFPGAVTFAPGDSVSFDLILDSYGGSAGATFPITIDYDFVNTSLGVSNGTVSGPEKYQTVLWKKFGELGIPATTSSGGSVSSDAGYVTIWSGGIAGESVNNVTIANINSTLPGGGALGLEVPSTYSYGTAYAGTSMDFTEPFTMSATDSISFDLVVNYGAIQSFTIDKADIDAALGSADAIVVSGIDMAKVLEYKVGATGLIFSGSPSAVSISVNTAMHPEKGSLSNFTFSNVTGNVTPAGVGFMEIDITTAPSLDLHIYAIENMMSDAISAAATLGSLSVRIEKQAEFAAKMISNIDKGIGRLVDADMNETSTRLKAIQTQQQLAIQSLSIANANAENVTQLFR